MLEAHRRFLETIQETASQYDSVRMGGIEEPLNLSFWSWRDIQDGLLIREEWGVGANLVPFYGDWHDLFCLNDHGQVVAINDERSLLFTWASAEAFVNSLLRDAPLTHNSTSTPTLVSAEISDEFKRKVHALLAKRKA